MKDKKQRKLHVIAQSGYDYKDVPAIILKGKWLSDYDFTAGKEITVTCQQGKLIISDSFSILSINSLDVD